MKLIWIYRLKVSIVMCTLAFSGLGQTIKYVPGPADLDTNKFAHVYFIRNEDDGFPDIWLGVIINNDEGICVKAKMNQIYRINTLENGSTRFHTKFGNNEEELVLNLNPGRNYYIEIIPEKNNVENDFPVGKAKLVELNEIEGEARRKLYKGIIEERYTILPYGNHDFLQNRWRDSVNWYASEKYDFKFEPLPSWEVILRSKIFTSFGFRNKLISETYSEVGGIINEKSKKCKTKIDFENYCKNSFIKTIIDKKRDSLTYFDIKSISAPPGIEYATIINTEIKNIRKKDGKPLLIRTSQVLFYWINEKGKGKIIRFYTSERGLEKELHSSLILEERILWAWKSFMLVKKN